MADREKVIKEFADYVYYFKPYCIGDIEDHAMLKDALELLKEQEELLRKLQKDKDKLCLDVSEWKHKFHDRPLKEQEAVKPKSKSRHGEYPQIVHRCGNCNEILYRYYKF